MQSLYLPVAGVLLGCQANVFCLEFILRDTRGPAVVYALTALQFAVVSAFSYVCLRVVGRRRSSNDGTWSWRSIPWRYHVLLALLHWLVSVSGNISLSMKVPVPVHAAVRSSSLLLNLFVGRCWFGASYNGLQYVCGVVLMAGLTLLAVAQHQQTAAPLDNVLNPAAAGWWFSGLLVLLGSSVLNTLFSFIQEKAMRQSPTSNTSPLSSSARWLEVLLGTHGLSLPLFLVAPFVMPASSPSSLTLSQDLRRLASGVLSSTASSGQLLIPGLMVAGNAVTQFICICGVCSLLHSTGATTLVWVLTCRRLLTLLVSIVYFRHYRSFLLEHWVGLALAVSSSSVFPFVSRKKQKEE